MPQTPIKKELRNFGLMLGAMFALVFGLLIPWIWKTAMPTWPWILAGISWFWALLLPGTLDPVYRAWMKIAHGVGWVNTRILLILVFYLVVCPTGALIRLFGKDPLARRFDAHAPTYRVQSKPPSRNHMERPF